MRRPLRSNLSRSIADLAIELGDPGRMMRARKLHRAGSVGEIVVEPRRLQAAVFGSDHDPYEATVESDGSGSLAGPEPEFGRIRCECTCPDWGDACKHALALLLTFAEEVEEHPQLASMWLEDGVLPSSDANVSPPEHPFLMNDRLASFTKHEPTPSRPTRQARLVFDTTDAWPVLQDAIDAMSRTAADLDT